MSKKQLKPRSTSFGRRLSDAMGKSVAQLREARRDGKRWPDGWVVRTYVVPDPPAAYSPSDLRKLRTELGDIDQGQFAKLAGVSLALVQSWETGRRKPSLLARRLLDEINRDLKHWQAYFKPAPAKAGTRRPRANRQRAA